MWDAGAADCIVQWLLAFSAFHLHDPAHPQIILSVANKQQVYETYASEFLVPAERRFFPRNNKGEYYLPSRAYFFSVWRSDAKVKHIRVRKYHSHGLCDKCVQFIDRRRTNPDEKEKQKILKEERAHYLYVRYERLAYYMGI
jgi:hypothetical protein